MRQRIRWAAAGVVALCLSGAFYGCAIKNYQTSRTLLKSDASAQELVESRLKNAKSLDEAAAEMRGLGFMVSTRHFPSPAGVGEPYLACNSLISGPKSNETCNVDVEVGISEEGKPVVVRLERTIKPL